MCVSLVSPARKNKRSHLLNVFNMNHKSSYLKPRMIRSLQLFSKRSTSDCPCRGIILIRIRPCQGELQNKSALFRLQNTFLSYIKLRHGTLKGSIVNWSRCKGKERTPGWILFHDVVKGDSGLWNSYLAILKSFCYTRNVLKMKLPYNLLVIIFVQGKIWTLSISTWLMKYWMSK